MSFMLLKFIRWCLIHRLGSGVQLIGFILLFVLLQLHASLLVVNNIQQFFIYLKSCSGVIWDLNVTYTLDGLKNNRWYHSLFNITGKPYLFPICF